MAKRQPMVALLRGINVGGNRRVPMVELRKLAEDAALQSVSTYIQSGNIVFSSEKQPAQVEALLEKGIVKHFGFEVPVIVRTAAQWKTYAKGSAFRDAESARPNLLHLALSKGAPADGAEKALRDRAVSGERIKITNDAIWIDFAEGVARSKLSPAFLDKTIGSTVTARNWKSVLALHELVSALEES